MCIYTMIRNPYLWSVFRLILSLKSSKLRIFSLNPLIFKLKYIGFSGAKSWCYYHHTRISNIQTLQKLWDKDWFTHIISRIWVFYRRLFLGFEYFNAIYFSDLSILTRFISRIWVFSLYLRLLLKQLKLWQNIYIAT